MQYKYIALDFDGTILNKQHKLSCELKELLIELQNKGVKVILCSGRNIEGMRFVMEEINIIDYDTYIVSCNGGEVYEVKNREIKNIKSLKFEYDVVKQMKSLIQDETKIMVAFEGEKAFLNKFSFLAYYSQLKYGRRPSIGIKGDVNKILLISTVEKINQKYPKVKSLMKLFDPEINVFRSVPTLIELTPKGATKGEALEILFNDNNLNKDELIAFGDGENDIEMLSFAGLGVCMENGFDTTKQEANVICDSNENNGVYKYLKEVYDK